jgi:hypothetical protein
MNYEQRFFTERLAHHKATMTHPGTTCYRCGALAEWRQIAEDGRQTPGTEWCYCSGCGIRLHGEVSPWNDAAGDDWSKTPYMVRNSRRWALERIYGRIKHRAGIPASYRLIEI